ncbi:hypothetical protein ACWXWI_23005, partial [Pantoea ananatis]
MPALRPAAPSGCHPARTAAGHETGTTRGLFMTGITPEINTTSPAPAASGNGACPFLLPPELPVMKGPAGIFWDFNDGARVLLPEGRWRVALLDDD